VSQLLYVGLFIVTAGQAVRRFQRTTVDTALLFGVAALLVAEGWVVAALGLPSNRILEALGGSLLMALPYLQVRLLDDFAGVPRAWMRIAEAGLALSVIIMVVIPPPSLASFALPLVAYFVGMQVYAAVRFFQESRRTAGMTRRRMQAVAVGSGCLGIVILAAGLQVAAPMLAAWWVGVSEAGAVASGVAFYIGFAPPGVLRRAWREPELRAFLRGVVEVPRLHDPAASVRTVDESSAAKALGALRAAVFAEDDPDLVQLLADQIALALGYAGELVQLERAEAEVAARARVENALRTSEETKSAILASALDAIITMDHDGQIAEFNAAAERMFGYGRAQVLGLVLADVIIPTALRDKHRRGLMHYNATGDGPVLGQRLELSALRADGTEFPVELTITRLPTEGPPMFTGFLRDLTERKQAETSQTLLAAIVESSSDAIISKTMDGIVTSWNPAAERTYGYSAKEMIGQSIVRLIPPDERAEFAAILTSLQRGAPITEIETTRIRKDTTPVYVSLSISPMRDHGGLLVGATSIARDVSERKRADEERETAAEAIRALNADLERRVVDRTRELEDAITELEAFSYSVSHDLRAPLRAVSGFSRILLEEHGSALPDEAQHYLGLVTDNARQMSRLIDDLLAFARLSRQPLQKKLVPCDEIVGQVLVQLAPEHVGRKVEIVIGTLPSCGGDPALVKQVFVNLLSNALKFTRKREVAHIEVGCRQEDGEVIYFVRDDGAGFDMQYAHKLFGVFQRLHRAEDFDGTGVGLAIVQRIVHRHGGRIWAEGAPDHGATFFFSLERAGAAVSAN
jgi:PAS domain S-box-containing protein